MKKIRNFNNRLNLNSLMFIGMGIVPPIIPVFFKLALTKAYFRLNDILICLLILIIGTLFTFFNNNFIALANWILLAAFVLYAKKINSFDNFHSLFPLTIWFSISLIAGYLFPAVDGLETRVSLYGGETNFTGFYLLIFSLALFAKKKIYAAYFVIVLTIALTLSRTAAVIGLMIWLWRRYGNRFSFIGMFGLIFFSTIVLYLALSYGVFDSTGYVFGPSRIYQLNDSSTSYRIDLIITWFGYLTSDISYLWIGYPPDNIEYFYSQTDTVVHNSFILKSITCGVIYSLILIYISYRILPIEVFVVMMAYCFVLHGLLSIPLIVLLRFLFGNERKVF